MSLRSIVRWAGSLIGIGGFALCLVLVSQGMRSVEKIGGNCASGGPYAIARPCPSGVPGLLTGGIFAGLFFLALFGFCVSSQGRVVLGLAWPALFLTLGWNFLDYGIHPPGGGGISFGFLIPAVLFIIMGAVPLYWVIPGCFHALRGDVDGSMTSQSHAVLPIAADIGAHAPAWPGTGTVGATTVPAGAPPTAVSAWPTSSPISSSTTSTPAGGTDVAGELDQLASLHARGELSDQEYEEAKRKTLDTPRST
jgi:hypothetical protein